MEYHNMKHNCYCQTLLNINEDIINPYNSYRNGLQILCNYLMEYFKDWQIFITEHDIDVFRLNFCSTNNRVNDTSFLITKEQLKDFSCTMEHIIIPTIVHLEQNEEDCVCQM